MMEVCEDLKDQEDLKDLRDLEDFGDWRDSEIRKYNETMIGIEGEIYDMSKHKESFYKKKDLIDKNVSLEVVYSLPKIRDPLYFDQYFTCKKNNVSRICTVVLGKLFYKGVLAANILFSSQISMVQKTFQGFKNLIHVNMFNQVFNHNMEREDFNTIFRLLNNVDPNLVFDIFYCKKNQDEQLEHLLEDIELHTRVNELDMLLMDYNPIRLNVVANSNIGEVVASPDEGFLSKKTMDYLFSIEVPVMYLGVTYYFSRELRKGDFQNYLMMQSEVKKIYSQMKSKFLKQRGEGMVFHKKKRALLEEEAKNKGMISMFFKVKEAHVFENEDGKEKIYNDLSTEGMEEKKKVLTYLGTKEKWSMKNYEEMFESYDESFGMTWTEFKNFFYYNKVMDCGSLIKEKAQKNIQSWSLMMLNKIARKVPTNLNSFMKMYLYRITKDNIEFYMEEDYMNIYKVLNAHTESSSTLADCQFYIPKEKVKNFLMACNNEISLDEYLACSNSHMNKMLIHNSVCNLVEHIISGKFGSLEMKFQDTMNIYPGVKRQLTPDFLFMNMKQKDEAYNSFSFGMKNIELISILKTKRFLDVITYSCNNKGVKRMKDIKNEELPFILEVKSKGCSSKEMKNLAETYSSIFKELNSSSGYVIFIKYNTTKFYNDESLPWGNFLKRLSMGIRNTYSSNVFDNMDRNNDTEMEVHMNKFDWAFPPKDGVSKDHYMDHQSLLAESVKVEPINLKENKVVKDMKEFLGNDAKKERYKKLLEKIKNDSFERDDVSFPHKESMRDMQDLENKLDNYYDYSRVNIREEYKCKFVPFFPFYNVENSMCKRRWTPEMVKKFESLFDMDYDKMLKESESLFSKACLVDDMRELDHDSLKLAATTLGDSTHVRMVVNRDKTHIFSSHLPPVWSSFFKKKEKDLTKVSDNSSERVGNAFGNYLYFKDFMLEKDSSQNYWKDMMSEYISNDKFLSLKDRSNYKSLMETNLFTWALMHSQIYQKVFLKSDYTKEVTMEGHKKDQKGGYSFIEEPVLTYFDEEARNRKHNGNYIMFSFGNIKVLYTVEKSMKADRNYYIKVFYSKSMGEEKFSKAMKSSKYGHKMQDLELFSDYKAINEISNRYKSTGWISIAENKMLFDWKMAYNLLTHFTFLSTWMSNYPKISLKWNSMLIPVLVLMENNREAPCDGDNMLHMMPNLVSFFCNMEVCLDSYKKAGFRSELAFVGYHLMVMYSSNKELKKDKSGEWKISKGSKKIRDELIKVYTMSNVDFKSGAKSSMNPLEASMRVPFSFSFEEEANMEIISQNNNAMAYNSNPNHGGEYSGDLNVGLEVVSNLKNFRELTKTSKDVNSMDSYLEKIRNKDKTRVGGKKEEGTDDVSSYKCCFGNIFSKNVQEYLEMGDDMEEIPKDVLEDALKSLASLDIKDQNFCRYLSALQYETYRDEMNKVNINEMRNAMYETLMDINKYTKGVSEGFIISDVDDSSLFYPKKCLLLESLIESSLSHFSTTCLSVANQNLFLFTYILVFMKKQRFKVRDISIYQIMAKLTTRFPEKLAALNVMKDFMKDSSTSQGKEVKDLKLSKMRREFDKKVMKMVEEHVEKNENNKVMRDSFADFKYLSMSKKKERLENLVNYNLVFSDQNSEEDVVFFIMLSLIRDMSKWGPKLNLFKIAVSLSSISESKAMDRWAEGCMGINTKFIKMNDKYYDKTFQEVKENLIKSNMPDDVKEEKLSLMSIIHSMVYNDCYLPYFMGMMNGLMNLTSSFEHNLVVFECWKNCMEEFLKENMSMLVDFISSSDDISSMLSIFGFLKAKFAKKLLNKVIHNSEIRYLVSSLMSNSKKFKMLPFEFFEYNRMERFFKDTLSAFIKLNTSFLNISLHKDPNSQLDMAISVLSEGVNEGKLSNPHFRLLIMVYKSFLNFCYRSADYQTLNKVIEKKFTYLPTYLMDMPILDAPAVLQCNMKNVIFSCQNTNKESLELQEKEMAIKFLAYKEIQDASEYTFDNDFSSKFQDYNFPMRKLAKEEIRMKKAREDDNRILVFNKSMKETISCKRRMLYEAHMCMEGKNKVLSGESRTIEAAKRNLSMYSTSNTLNLSLKKPMPEDTMIPQLYRFVLERWNMMKSVNPSECTSAFFSAQKRMKKSYLTILVALEEVMEGYSENKDKLKFYKYKEPHFPSEMSTPKFFSNYPWEWRDFKDCLSKSSLENNNVRMLKDFLEESFNLVVPETCSLIEIANMLFKENAWQLLNDLHDLLVKLSNKRTKKVIFSFKPTGSLIENTQEWMERNMSNYSMFKFKRLVDTSLLDKDYFYFHKNPITILFKTYNKISDKDLMVFQEDLYLSRFCDPDNYSTLVSNNTVGKNFLFLKTFVEAFFKKGDLEEKKKEFSQRLRSTFFQSDYFNSEEFRTRDGSSISALYIKLAGMSSSENLLVLVKDVERGCAIMVMSTTPLLPQVMSKVDSAISKLAKKKIVMENFLGVDENKLMRATTSGSEFYYTIDSSLSDHLYESVSYNFNLFNTNFSLSIKMHNFKVKLHTNTIKNINWGNEGNLLVLGNKAKKAMCLPPFSHLNLPIRDHWMKANMLSWEDDMHNKNLYFCTGTELFIFAINEDLHWAEMYYNTAKKNNREFIKNFLKCKDVDFANKTTSNWELERVQVSFRMDKEVWTVYLELMELIMGDSGPKTNNYRTFYLEVNKNDSSLHYLSATLYFYALKMGINASLFNDTKSRIKGFLERNHSYEDDSYTNYLTMQQLSRFVSFSGKKVEVALMRIMSMFNKNKYVFSYNYFSRSSLTEKEFHREILRTSNGNDRSFFSQYRTEELEGDRVEEVELDEEITRWVEVEDLEEDDEDEEEAEEEEEPQGPLDLQDLLGNLDEDWI